MGRRRCQKCRSRRADVRTYGRRNFATGARFSVSVCKPCMWALVL